MLMQEYVNWALSIIDTLGLKPYIIATVIITLAAYGLKTIKDAFGK